MKEKGVSDIMSRSKCEPANENVNHYDEWAVIYHEKVNDPLRKGFCE